MEMNCLTLVSAGEVFFFVFENSLMIQLNSLLTKTILLWIEIQILISPSTLEIILIWIAYWIHMNPLLKLSELAINFQLVTVIKTQFFLYTNCWFF